MSNDTVQAPVETRVVARKSRPRLRNWLPLAIIVLEIIGLGITQYLMNAELVPPAEGGLTQRSMLALGTLLIFLWFVFLSAAPIMLRKSAGIVALVLAVAVVLLVRIEGVTGDIHLHLNWRWAPRADETLPSADDTTGGRTVDLTQTSETDAPQFLGPERTGVYARVALARDWSQAKPKLLWRQPIGAGWSSFAIVGHFGVTQEQRGEEELVTCYDLDDGKLQWAQATPVRFHELLAGVGPRATPTIDGGRVYALGALGHLHCLDGATGKVIWKHDIVTETKATPPQWGKSSSPLIYGDLVIVSAGGSNDNSLLALDKLDGHVVWSAGDDMSDYSSPVVMTLSGVPQIVMASATKVTSHDPSTGKILWQHPWPESATGPNVSQPVAVGDDRILLTKGYGIGSTLWQIKLDGDKWSVEPLWRNNNLKTKMTSAVFKDGYAFGLDEGTLSCLEVATGKKLWKRGRFGHGQVLLVGDLLLVQSEDGEIALVEPNPKKFVELVRMPVVEGQSWNYPVLWGNKLVVRTDSEMACYELPEALPSDAAVSP